MTERLRTLLHAEVDELDIPAPRVAETLTEGRQLRRRRRTGQLTSVLAAVAAVAAIATATSLGNNENGRTQTAVADPGPDGQVAPVTAWATGNRVYLGDGSVSAAMPEVAQTLYYTSAGVLVRTNRDGSSDGGAPFHFQLVSPQGQVTPVGVTLGEVVPGTDPTEPYLAWATMNDAHTIHLVIFDVAQNKEVAKVDIPGSFTWGGWEAPPVALSGDTVFVAADGGTLAVDWKTGDVEPARGLPAGTVPDVHAGRALAERDGHQTVVDVATGETVRQLDAGGDGYVTLSPDGRYVTEQAVGTGRYSRVEVVAVDNGDTESFITRAQDWGWTSDGHPFTVIGGELSECDPDTGACTASPVPGGDAATNGELRLGGRVYES